jgi:hypothetical protein
VSDNSYRIDTGDVNRHDLAEAARRPKTSRLAGVLRLAMVVCGCVLLAVVLIRGAQPELTPEEIVQLESYEGQQEARRIFNLNSAKQQSIAALRSTAPKAQEDKNSRVAEVALPPAEVPAVGAAVTLPVPQSAAPSGMAADQYAATGTGVSGSSERPVESPRILPIYSVTAESAGLHESPSQSAPTLKTVSKNDTVTLFNNVGDWAEVAVNDGSGVTGYVRRAAISILQE